MVREAFNSPFRPFILATTSVGQEGLDFHSYCHRVWHWNLPRNPVDMEQREGRVNRYKGHAVRKNVARSIGLAGLAQDWNGRGDPWDALFKIARQRLRDNGSNESELMPYWISKKARIRVAWSDLCRCRRSAARMPDSKRLNGVWRCIDWRLVNHAKRI